MRYLLLETTVYSAYCCVILDSAEPQDDGLTKVCTIRSDGMVEGGNGKGGGIKRRVDGNFVSTAALSYQLSSIRLTRSLLSVL